MKKKKPSFEEYIINDSHIEKLYNMYIKQSWFDKLIDVLVLFAIIFTVVSVVLQLTMEISQSVLYYIHSFSSIILLIFIIELMRSYARSKSKRHFFKHHWIDIILVALLSLFFLFSYLGLAKLKGIPTLKAYLQEAKHTRIIFQLFKR